MTETFQPVLRTQADLEQCWRHLMQPLGFSGHSVWMLVIGPDDRPYPRITEFADAEDPPSDEQVDGFAEALQLLHHDGVRFAFLRSRPGGGGVSPDDRAWASSLYAAGRRAGVPVDVVHRAHDHDVVPVPMDDLLAEPA